MFVERRERAAICKKFFKVGGSISMDTLMCEEKDFIFDPSRNWKPM